MRKFTFLFALCAALAATRLVLADGISAGPNPSDPTATPSSYSGNHDGFLIVEDVAYDGSADQWTKALVNVGPQQIFSGQLVEIDERLTNVGQLAWTDWHERVLSLTDTGGGPGLQPGFLFEKDSVSVYRNGGLLSQGTDYTLVPEVSQDPGNANDWVGLSIFFNPGATIQPGNTLRITKNIFEVFGDGNTWMTTEPNNVALIAEYPTAIPEPTAIGLTLLASLVVCCRRSSKRRPAAAMGS